MKEKDTAVLAVVGTHLEATITKRASPYLRKLLELKHFALASRDVKITFTVTAALRRTGQHSKLNL